MVLAVFFSNQLFLLTIWSAFMRRVNSTDFKTHFGEFIELAREGPIEVLYGGKPVCVFLSPDEFAHLQRLNDANPLAWTQAKEASGERTGHDEAKRLLAERPKQPK